MKTPQQALSELKIMRSFRLSRECLKKLSALSQTEEMSQSQLIEKLVNGLAET
ncbi:MAG: hypothetical protein HYR96_13925 [Deltaproteobacteria bacterium]|nr:hypothetical protein [Deltaproteobacteria bacterium]MBI3293892.1 hypothetical protein [Deltaproteobacteria bacterium]